MKTLEMADATARLKDYARSGRREPLPTAGDRRSSGFTISCEEA